MPRSASSRRALPSTAALWVLGLMVTPALACLVTALGAVRSGRDG
ncbi:MAG TPA: hypothetical protein VI700_06230 [Thermoanaerobaculaceae bacterium]|nr:hypothetical protein [Thermoanaerobaculaceae bacterium]